MSHERARVHCRACARGVRPTLQCLANAAVGIRTKSTPGAPFLLLPSLRAHNPLALSDLYFFGQGTVELDVTVCCARPPSPAKISSALTGKPPRGHVFGTLP